MFTWSPTIKDDIKMRKFICIPYCAGAAGLPAFPFGATSQIPGMNLYFVVNMEPNSHNETFNTLKIGLEVQACLNHSALANANVRKSKELGKKPRE